MLMMRLQRVGRRNEPHYKIVVIEKTKGPKSQKYVDIIGSYNPKLGRVMMDNDKAKTWLSNGVQPSDTVRNMLITEGLLEGSKVNVLPKKAPTKKKNAPEIEEAPAEVATEEAEAPAEEEVTEETPAETTEETPVEEEVATEEEAPVAEETEAPAEEVTEEAPVEEETPAEEVATEEEAPAEEEKTEE